MEKGIGIWMIDTEEEYEDEVKEFLKNPDMVEVGIFSSMCEVYDEFAYQGFEDSDVNKFSLNRYGTVIDILQYLDTYHVFIGTR